MSPADGAQYACSGAGCPGVGWHVEEEWIWHGEPDSQLSTLRVQGHYV